MVKNREYLPHIDNMLIENQLLVRIPELSWASLEIRKQGYFKSKGIGFTPALLTGILPAIS